MDQEIEETIRKKAELEKWRKLSLLILSNHASF